MTAPSSDPKTRRWRLLGFGDDKKPGDGKRLLRESHPRGDAELDRAIKQLERDPQITRIRAERT